MTIDAFPATGMDIFASQAAIELIFTSAQPKEDTSWPEA